MGDKHIQAVPDTPDTAQRLLDINDCKIAKLQQIVEQLQQIHISMQESTAILKSLAQC